ncbi:hypothetical protein R5W24_005459 [Gemmata sp. JC717]|uniref:hypothetical protein n=1 Tax=Gemmata algarum TaxID=2975278 RepID=UPI0021BB9397|nr:hypothetical protein [Gemmata algarum]MDY3556296.1 hypothetical protein [Gemmata algarum]
MPIDFVCPNCFRPYSAPEQVAGRAMTCSDCGHPTVIPKSQPLALASPSPAPAAEQKRHRASDRRARPLPPERPAPKPREVQPLDEGRHERPSPRRPKAEQSRDEELSTALLIRRRKRANGQAKVMMGLKLMLFLACLVGIFAGLRAAIERIQAVQQQQHFKSLPATR